MLNETISSCFPNVASQCRGPDSAQQLDVKGWGFRGSLRLILLLAHDRKEQGAGPAAGLC